MGRTLGQAALKQAVVSLPSERWVVKLEDALDVVTSDPASLSVNQLRAVSRRLEILQDGTGTHLLYRRLLRAATADSRVMCSQQAQADRSHLPECVAMCSALALSRVRGTQHLSNCRPEDQAPRVLRSHCACGGSQ